MFSSSKMRNGSNQLESPNSYKNIIKSPSFNKKKSENIKIIEKGGNFKLAFREKNVKSEIPLYTVNCLVKIEGRSHTVRVLQQYTHKKIKGNENIFPFTFTRLQKGHKTLKKETIDLKITCFMSWLLIQKFLSRKHDNLISILDLKHYYSMHRVTLPAVFGCFYACLTFGTHYAMHLLVCIVRAILFVESHSQRKKFFFNSRPVKIDTECSEIQTYDNFTNICLNILRDY